MAKARFGAQNYVWKYCSSLVLADKKKKRENGGSAPLTWYFSILKVLWIGLSIIQESVVVAAAVSGSESLSSPDRW